MGTEIETVELDEIEVAIKKEAAELWGSEQQEQEANGEGTVQDGETGNETNDETAEGNEENDGQGNEASESQDEQVADEGQEVLTDEPEEEDELTKLKTQVKALTDFIESQSKQQAERGSSTAVEPPVAKPIAKAEAAVTVESAAAVASNLTEFLGELDFDEVRESPEMFLAVLAKVAEFTEKKTLAALQSNLPTLVTEHVTRTTTTKELVDSFYRDNKELAGVKQTMGVVAQNVAIENPALGLTEILTEAAKRVRAMLGLKATKPVVSNDKANRSGEAPVQPGKIGGKRKTSSPSKLSPLAKEVQDLFNIK